ncbi:MAG: hypothetical protein LBD57_02625 [Endomicrobium sp.]|jgi:hypothetical protein|nr:hypothetical protein [Endomicrobium sp.]
MRCIYKNIKGVVTKVTKSGGGVGLAEIGVISIMGVININLSGRGYIGARERMEGMLKVEYAKVEYAI